LNSKATTKASSKVSRSENRKSAKSTRLTKVAPTLTQDEIQSLLQARHADAFGVLGLHDNPNGKGLVARALFPGADSVELIARTSGKKIASLKPIHPDGVFEATMGNRKNRFEYFYRVSWGEVTRDQEDLYRFPSLLSEDDAYLFCQGSHEQAYRFLGANPATCEGVEGVLFTVWAPAASRVSVVADFNHWDGRTHVMRKHPGCGIWELFVPEVAQHALYKYEVIDAEGNLLPLKADPYARSMQHPPETASRVILDQDYQWNDGDWMQQRAEQTHLDQPVSIYEIHAGSWRRKPEEGNRYLSYRELADELIPYVLDMGFTHVQLMPVSEFPFDGSWGYQPIGMYAPSIRFGTPDEFKYFVDACHRNNIGVLLDWVPGHFPTDQHGLGRFDGTCLYEHEDLRQGFHPDWNTLVYNYGRCEVMSYLISNANYWLDEFHLDGLRVDAVASMLYLDYSREEGEWIPNEHGGRENLEAISLLQAVNSRMYKNHPGIMMIAEESTAWPGVSKPVDGGGLGFGYKWNMGWMNDSLRYMEKDPIHRQYHHNEMTFSTVYAWDENFVLPISHDEVVHGKGSLLNKMPGDEWQRFANLRAYLGFMWTHPGKKLLFQGCEFAQGDEWNHDESLQWHLLQYDFHRGVQELVRDLNKTYRQLPSLHQLDADGSGFEWLQLNSQENSIFAWLRKGGDEHLPAVVISNMTPQTHFDYQLGVPHAGAYSERLNTDDPRYGGSGQANGELHTTDIAWDNQPHSLFITVPPLATVILQFDRG
jgi:1,4-alpha-glucan branching enzyme